MRRAAGCYRLVKNESLLFVRSDSQKVLAVVIRMHWALAHLVRIEQVDGRDSGALTMR